MSTQVSIEEFYRRAAEGKLFASICLECKTLSIPPRKICPKCNSSNADWYELKNTGEIESFTIIYVPPKIFEKEAPYAVCLIKLDEGVKILARMKIKEKQPKIGERVSIKAEKNYLETWPSWPFLIAEFLE